MEMRHARMRARSLSVKTTQHLSFVTATADERHSSTVPTIERTMMMIALVER